MTYQLHDYQKVAVEFLLGQDRAALFLDMGLGKTAIVLSALEPRHLPALVVAPKRVAEEVWHVERDLWRPDLTIARAVGSPAERAAALTSGADIVVLARDNLGDLMVPDRARPTVRKLPFRTLVIDELSGYKGRGVRWKTLRRVKTALDIPHVWGLTGTPSPNGYLDLWPQITLLDDGERLGKNITTYRSRYFQPGRQLANGTVVGWDLRPEAEDHIKALIDDICLAMETDGRVQLPPITFNPVAIELPAAAKKVYNDMAADMVADTEAVFGGEIHTASSAAVLTNKLSQIAAGFIYRDDAEGEYQPLHVEKLKALEEIVDSAQGSGVLVFYHYRPEREMILQAVSGARTIEESGVVGEWNAGRVPVLVAHPASAGHGLNLQHGGHTQVWTSPDWDLELWEQGVKRTHRQGQQHPVVVHLLLGNRTIDHKVRARLLDKAEVQHDLLDYLRSPI